MNTGLLPANQWQSQGEQRPNDGQACQHAMLASVRLREEDAWLSRKSVLCFNCELSLGLKKAQKTECISIKTDTNGRLIN